MSSETVEWISVITGCSLHVLFYKLNVIPDNYTCKFCNTEDDTK